jgi:hypothetical protein
MSQKYHAEVHFEVFAHVYVDAENEQAARDQIAKGGGYLSGCMEFQEHTADMVQLETIEMVEDNDPEPEEDE